MVSRAPLTMVYGTPFPWFFDFLPMDYWIPYPWYFDPPTHWISSPLTWTFAPLVHGLPNPLSMVFRTPTHGISNPSPWYIESSTHGTSNPLFMVYGTPLSMVNRTPTQTFRTPCLSCIKSPACGIFTLFHGIVTPYQWYIEPPFHGVLDPLLMIYRNPCYGIMNHLYMIYQTPYPWYFEPLPLIFWTLKHCLWTPYTWHIVHPMLFWPRNPWYIEHHLMVFWLWTPLFLVEMEASIYHEGVQNAKCKDEYFTTGSEYHMLFKLLVPRGCWLKRNIIEKSSYKWRLIFFRQWYTYKLIYQCCWRETKHMTMMGSCPL